MNVHVKYLEKRAGLTFWRMVVQGQWSISKVRYADDTVILADSSNIQYPLNTINQQG